MDGVITVSAADRAIAQNSGGEAQREKAHEGYRRSGEPLRCVCGTLCGLPRCWVDTTPPEYPLERYATACGLVQRLP